MLRKVHLIPILVFFNTFLPPSPPSTQLNYLGPSHFATGSHLPVRCNWSDSEATALINTAYLLQLPFNQLSSPPPSPQLSSNGPCLGLGLGIDWTIFAEFLTSPHFLPSTTCPTASQRFSPTHLSLSPPSVQLVSKPSLRHPIGTAAVTNTNTGKLSLPILHLLLSFQPNTTALRQDRDPCPVSITFS